ncbi:MAG TPA: SufD family Fe-S cluster assembly protein [Candidatus Pacebacteria bacterium]|nr:SufD family Fe-S cluster assembly protein [Candidatus Paceibacterota bacterium]
MFINITKDNQKIYKITTPGEHIFYFENKTGHIIFDIACENADIKIYGLYQCKDSDKLTLNITQKHSAPNSTSDVLIKSILRDKSTFNFTGLIHIFKNAVNSTAHLTNTNLLLGTDSHVITSPQLEVVPNQVDCEHSAKTIPLDILQLNYIISRGISEESAKQLLINGFISEIKKIKE